MAGVGLQKTNMPSVIVEITSLVDDKFPGFVECTLVDADGRSHTFVEKVSVVTQEPLGLESEYPCEGAIRCEVEEEFVGFAERQLVRINTRRPHDIESARGETIFVVLYSQVRS